MKPAHPKNSECTALSSLQFLTQLGVILAVLTTECVAKAQLSYDPNGDASGDPMTGTGGGGSGGWYSGAIWWNGTGSQYWDGSTAVFNGAAGTATLEGGVNANAIYFQNNGHVIDLNGYNLNVVSSLVLNSGVAATIVGSGSTGNNLSGFSGGGNLQLGNGSALSGSQFGFTVFGKGGTVTINNNASGSAAFNSYIQFNAANNHLPITLAGNGYVGTGGADLVAEYGHNMIISPGLAPGQIGGLKFDGTLTLNANGGNVLFNADLGGTTPGTYDTLITSGSLGIVNGQTLINISMVNGYIPTVGDSFDLLQAAGGISIGGGSDILIGNIPDGVTFSDTVVGNNLVLTVESVPEPSSLALLGLGLLPLLAVRARQSRMPAKPRI